MRSPFPGKCFDISLTGRRTEVTEVVEMEAKSANPLIPVFQKESGQRKPATHKVKRLLQPTDRAVLCLEPYDLGQAHPLG